MMLRTSRSKGAGGPRRGLPDDISPEFHLLRAQGEATSDDVEPHHPAAGIRIAVVGCGYWGSKHVRVLYSTPGVAHIALVDLNVCLARALQSSFPASSICETLEQALPLVDAVVIATPPRSHASLTLKAIRAGKHALVEKPLTTSLGDALCIAEEAERVGTVCMVGHTFQFNPAVRELRRRMHAGEFGQIYYIHSARLNLGLYRPDVNVVWDLAPHDISILNFLLDAEPKAVDAWGASLAFAGVEDMAYLRLEYDDPKVTGYAHLSWLDPRKTRTLTVVGSKKMAVYDDLAEEPLRIFDRGLHEPGSLGPSHERPPSYRYGDIVAPHIHPGEPLALQDRHFIDCIRHGLVPEACSEKALSIVAVLEALDRAMRHRSPVPVTSELAHRMRQSAPPSGSCPLPHTLDTELRR
jgi:predicted dehydrogenase